MHSHLHALQAMAPVSLRRVPSEVHSAAKRASFYIAFGRDFCGFRIDFGRFWEAKWKAKSNSFRTFIENAHFAKIIVFLKENCYFSGSEPREINQNWMLKRNEK